MQTPRPARGPSWRPRRGSLALAVRHRGGRWSSLDGPGSPSRGTRRPAFQVIEDAWFFTMILGQDVMRMDTGPARRGTTLASVALSLILAAARPPRAGTRDSAPARRRCPSHSKSNNLRSPTIRLGLALMSRVCMANHDTSNYALRLPVGYLTRLENLSPPGDSELEIMSHRLLTNDQRYRRTEISGLLTRNSDITRLP